MLFGEFSLSQGPTQLLTRFNFIHYRHLNHSRNNLVLPELLLRHYNDNLNFWELSLGTGLLRQKADAQIYEYEQTEFLSRNDPWFYFAPSAGIRYGYSISLPNGNALTPNLGGRFFYQYPFNDFALARVAFDLSITYQLQ